MLVLRSINTNIATAYAVSENSRDNMHFISLSFKRL